MFLHLEIKCRFGAKSAVFECRNFLYAYFLSSISRFSAGVRFSRPADSVNKAGLIFYFWKRARFILDFWKKGRAWCPPTNMNISAHCKKFLSFTTPTLIISGYDFLICLQQSIKKKAEFRKNTENFHASVRRAIF